MTPEIDQNLVDNVTNYLFEHLYDTVTWQIDDSGMLPDDDMFNELHAAYMNTIITKLYNERNELT